MVVNRRNAMIVQCPSCSTKYRFDDSKFKDELKVRCTRCSHVFKLSALGHQEPSEDLYSEDFSLGARKTKKEGEQSIPEWDPDDMNVDIVPSSKKPGERRIKIRNAFIALSSVLVLVLIIYISLSRLDNSFNLSFLSSQQEKEEIPQKTVFTEEDVKDISLENIRQYFVNNDKIGQLFVIEGQAVNNFNAPKSMIKLRASLYDSQGLVLEEKDFLCGNVASLFQLQVSSEQELESTLQSRLGILTTNKHVAPGQNTPFMVVFYNPPEEMQEFGLEVIEAHDPAP